MILGSTRKKLTEKNHSAKNFFYNNDFEDYEIYFNIVLKNGRRAKLVQSTYVRKDLSSMWDIHFLGPIFLEQCCVLMKKSENIAYKNWKDIKFVYAKRKR